MLPFPIVTVHRPSTMDRGDKSRLKCHTLSLEKKPEVIIVFVLRRVENVSCSGR